VYYSDTKLAWVAKAFGTVLACFLPVLSITILYFLDSEKKRLGAIAALAALLSFTLLLLTGARVVDIFAATAA
jgi:Na+(H+)/acetate symporter ActP